MSGTRILIVEDESIVAKDIEQRLINLGYQVTSISASGEAAVKKIKKEDPDIVLMDIKLKGRMDGIEAAEQIRTRFKIPVVYITAYADNQTLERAKITEPFGYILKPFEDTELKSAIELALYKHKIEGKLRESEEKFRTIFEKANDIIVYLNKDGKIIDINGKVEKILGFKRSRIINKNFLDLSFLGEETIAKFSDLFQNVLDTKDTTELMEVKIKDVKGKTKIFEVSTTIIEEEERGIQGFLGIVRDVTRRKNMEKALREEQRRTKELTKKIIYAQERERLYLASEIHDDLLQGLVAVLYFFQMIDLSKLDAKTLKQRNKLIEIIKTSIKRGRAMISEIEPLREFDAGFIHVIKKTIDHKFIDSKIKIDFKYPEKLPDMTLIIRTNIIRIIQEALTNINKHSRATAVSLELKVYKNNLRLKIEDNGIGFDLKNIMNKRTGHYGLLIMQERARLIGGSITIRTKPGKGTIIRGTFPLVDEQNEKR
ncbi:MAG TPA: PAS domain S-box protein [candidate division WOR-3 bacterium]|uniref:histidine kinase n=1 Tax=candidate division WOR-3 bacterium TaxID=2052148 RepID=A0A9C9EMN7_UNCW3|nr:PAS domain S-box protein [candidate division WOR-3 bacterium]